MSEHRVFISYPFSEANWARDFAKSLQERGLDVWLDQDRIRAGDPVLEAIESGLRESDVVVLLVTGDALNKPNLFFEIGAAIGMGKRLVPVVSPDVNPASLPLSLRVRRFLVKGSPEATAGAFISETAEPAPRAGL